MSRYSIGIDLGTTNSAVSYVDLEAAGARGHEQTMLSIPQVTAVGTVEERSLLPSFLYLPNDQEFPAGALALPWDKQRKDTLVGEFARSHGSKVPMRLVSSAKSWLCHAGSTGSRPSCRGRRPPTCAGCRPWRLRPAI